MIPKALKDYQHAEQVTVVSVSEEVEAMAQKISRLAPAYFHQDGVDTYQLAINQLNKGRKWPPYSAMIYTICTRMILRIFTAEQ